MVQHEKNIIQSINLNIIGTSNIVIVCKKLKIKLIYFSTSYIYPGDKGNYKEDDPILPVNNYAWSKLGGESAVQMYNNSLIIRACMTEKPFVHNKALTDVYLNFIFQEEIAKILPKLIKIKGILNVGGPIQTVYKFACKYNPSVKKISSINIKNVIYKKKMSMNVSKFRKIIKKKN
jgi:dTDP-4-dehydrorhamnose reductase